MQPPFAIFFMWAKKSRVTIPDFPKNAKTAFRGSYFVIKSAQNEEGRNRYGVIISTRIEPKAVRRHYVKRIWSEATRKIKDSGRDLLLVGLPPLKSADKESIQKEMLRSAASLNQ